MTTRKFNAGDKVEVIDNIDEWYRSKGMMFETKEEAIECTIKMLEAIK